MPLTAELDAALDAARAAATVINGLYRRNLTVTTKADRSPVTEADIRSEEAIREVLAKRFPSYGFYGEETGRSAMHAESVWLVDPILQTLEVFQRGQSAWLLLGTFGGDSKVRPEPFSAVELDLADIWPPLEPLAP